MAHLSAPENDNATPRPRLTPGGLLALSFLWFPINMFWTAMLQYALPVRVQELVGDAAKGEYLGYISFAGAIATTVIQLIVAPLSDACASKWGRRHPFVFWGILLNVFAVWGFATVGNFPLLMVSFFGIQLFLNIANGPYQTLLPDNVPPSQHGIASTYMGIALLTGQLMGAVTLLLRKQIGGIPGILGIVTVLLLIGMVITLTHVPDAPAPPEDRLPLGQSLATLTDLRVRENPHFFTLLGSRFFINLSYSTVVSFLLYYLQDAVGLGKEGAGSFQPFVIFTATVAGLLGTLAAGYALKTLSKKRVIYIACAILAAASLVFALTSGKPIVLLLAFVFGAGWGAFQAVDWALAVNLLPEGGAAKYMAVWHACMTIPQIIAPAFGKIADVLNKQYGMGFGWRAAMLSTVIYLGIGAYLLRYVQERAVVEDREAPSPTSSPALRKRGS